MRLTVRVLFIIAISIFFIPVHTSAEEAKEITLSNGEVVKVLFEERSKGYRYEVEFENGHHYYDEKSGNMGSSGGSLDLTEEEKILAKEAIDQYKQMYGDGTSSNGLGNPLGPVLILLGLLAAIFPKVAWFLEIGWKLHDAEPSKLALNVNRAGGILLAIFGLFILL